MKRSLNTVIIWTKVLGKAILILLFIWFFIFCIDNLSGSIDEPVEDRDTALHLTCLYGYLPCVQVSEHLILMNLYCLLFNVQTEF